MQHKFLLIGNPNTGKTTLFNALTGLNQKTGNFHGVTVDQKQGFFKHDGREVQITDLPGTYSIAPKSKDESIVLEHLLKEDLAELTGIIIVADATNLKKNLFLMHQAQELGKPIVLVINMMDLAQKKGFQIDIEGISSTFGVQAIGLNARKKEEVRALKQILTGNFASVEKKPFFEIPSDLPQGLQSKFEHSDFPFLSFAQAVQETQDPQLRHYLAKDTIKRYNQIRSQLGDLVQRDKQKDKSFTNKIDQILLHKVGGFMIFFAVLLLMFQAIYSWSALPMDFIDSSFSDFSNWAVQHLPSGPFFELIAEGLIPGIGGIVIFIPQIVILFMLLVFLEESGYMSRVIVLMDSSFKKLGLNGQSIIPLISGTACAIPAIMASRSISDWKQRLITILITPFTTCSARLPVYVILIAIAVPEGHFLYISYQAWALLMMYLIGFGSALLSAYILNRLIKISDSRNFLAIELPTYKWPVLKNVFWVMLDKTKAFVFGAGKIILAISIVLWVLGNFGPDQYLETGKAAYIAQLEQHELTSEEKEAKIAAYELEYSYLGLMGKQIEPVLKPLGLDWKVGIGLISSFAAREVFNSTMITIYSVENPDDNSSFLQKLKNARNSDGQLTFNRASSWGLLIFYAFALQCMSTLAVVVKETGSYKWAIYQFFGLGALAYVLSFVTYQLLK